MLKQYVVLPKEPKMSTGKLVSQGVHAGFMALQKQSKKYYQQNLIDKWKHSGQCVIVCQVPSQVELIGLKNYCEQWDIPADAYIDEGFTEIPMGTTTAFATGVLTEEQQEFFQKLELWEDDMIVVLEKEKPKKTLGQKIGFIKGYNGYEE